MRAQAGDRDVSQAGIDPRGCTTTGGGLESSPNAGGRSAGMIICVAAASGLVVSVSTASSGIRREVELARAGSRRKC